MKDRWLPSGFSQNGQISMQSILINQAQIHSINHKLKDGRLSDSILISGALDQNLARELGCEELVYLKNGTPRQGFPQLPLDVICGPFEPGSRPIPICISSLKLPETPVIASW